VTSEEVFWTLIVVLIATLPICSLLGGRFDYEDEERNNGPRGGDS
jgi:hypothetical protein